MGGGAGSGARVATGLAGATGGVGGPGVAGTVELPQATSESRASWRISSFDAEARAMLGLRPARETSVGAREDPA